MNSNKTGLKASTGEGGGSVSIFKLPLNWRDWEIVSYVYGEGGGSEPMLILERNSEMEN